MARILVVDDERGMRITLREFLRDAHYEVDVAEDSEQATSMLALQEFDVVLVDIIMPRITGVHLLKTIKEQWPHVQVLLITGDPTIETASEAVRAGADDYLIKPIGKEQLLKTVANAVKLKSLDDESRRLLAENQQYQENLERLVEERTADLRQSEERYRALAESAQDLIFTIDRQMMVQYANRAAIDFMGGKTIGKPLQELFPPEAFKRMNENLQSVFVSGTPVSVSSKFSLPDREVWLDTQLVPLSGETGGVNLVMGISRDITERKLMEQAQTRRADELAALYETSLEIGAQTELTTLLNTIVRRGATLVGADTSSILLLQPDDATLQITAEYKIGEITRIPTVRLGEGLAGRVAKSGEPLAISDYGQWAGRIHGQPTSQVQRIIGVPLKRGGQVIGVLTASDDEKKEPFSENDLQLLGSFAAQAALAIENARLFKQVRDGRERARALSGYLQTAQEDERTRISRQIHDDFGQQLTALKMDLAWILRHLSGDGAEIEAKVGGMAALIDNIIQNVRSIATALRPGLLDDLGLFAALDWQAKEFQEHTGIDCELRLIAEDIDPGRDLSTVIFRICQEALTNVARHAEASRVVITLVIEAGVLLLNVRDNGRGITKDEISNPKSLGLLGMRERVYSRGGKITFRGSQGQGTTVSAHLPLEAVDENTRED